MRTIDQREITVPGTGTQLADGRSSFRRILAPVRSPGESGSALAAAARICAMTNGLLRLVHVRTSDPPLRSPARFYRETAGEAAAALEQALLTAWPAVGRGQPPLSWIPGARMWPWLSRSRHQHGLRTLSC